jgi:hypothetical protein
MVSSTTTEAQRRASRLAGNDVTIGGDFDEATAAMYVRLRVRYNANGDRVGCGKIRSSLHEHRVILAER